MDTNYPHVTDDQARICREYADDLNNTGGNDPADLLNRLQDPGTDDRPNRLASTNVVVFTLAVAVQSQVSLLQRLEAAGRVTPSFGLDDDEEVRP